MKERTMMRGQVPQEGPSMPPLGNGPAMAVSPEEGLRLLAAFHAIACPEARERIVSLVMAEAQRQNGAPSA